MNLSQRIAIWLSENLSHGAKIWMAMLVTFLLFAGFVCAGIFISGRDLYLIMNNTDSIYYSGKDVFLLAQTPFFIIAYPPAVLNYLMMEKVIKKTKITNGIIATLYCAGAIWFVLAFITSFIVTPFVTDYVNEHYTSCEKHASLHSGARYVKGNAECYKP